MNSSNQQAHPHEAAADDSQQPSPHEMEASFRKTYESLEALFTSKRDKLGTLKQLVVAEAKLSLSSFLIAIGLGLLLLVAGITVWLLLNVALAYALFALIGSVWLSISVLLLLNIGVSVFLYFQIKKVWKLVGFPTASETLNEVV